MDLLPNVTKDFSSKDYWNKFFTKRTAAFEWYGDYLELCSVLHRYINFKDQVLMSGCGNSQLSEQLYDAGFKNITNIDISEKVINQMRISNTNRPEMNWMIMDVNNMRMEDNMFNVVLDKGTLDAMMSSEEGDKTVEKAFKEITRVLKVGGRYLVLSLAQDNVLQLMLDFFSSHNWLIRIHKVSLDECNSAGEWRMPLYLFVFTKVSQKFKLIEICFDDDEKPKRLKDEAEAKKVIKEQQYYAMIRNNLASKGLAKDLPQIELFSSDDVVNARYRIQVIDCKQQKKSFGIFIVPQGQEHTWIMGSKAGRQCLAESAGFGRLAVVYLDRNHTYENEDKRGMDLIQAELSSKIMQLAPQNLPKHYKTPFVSSGGTLGQRYVRAEFEINQKSIAVEDYKAVASNSSTYWCRRIVYQESFISLPASVITEIGLKSSNLNSKTKQNKKKSSQSCIANVKEVNPSKINYQPNQIVLGLLARKKLVLL